MKRYLILFFLFFTITICTAQNKATIDSLYKICKAQPKDVTSLFALLENLRYRDSTECKTIADEGLRLCKESNDISNECLFRNNLCMLYKHNNDAIKYKKELFTALQLCEKGNAKSKAYVNYRVGGYFYDAENSDSALYYYLKAEEQFDKINNGCLLQALLYQGFANIYSNKGLQQKQMQYANTGYKKAQVCGNTDGLLVSMFTLALAHQEIYRLNKVTNLPHKDSASQFYKKITVLGNAQDVTMYSVMSDAYFNIGTNYYEEDNIKFADSALQNFKKSIAISGTKSVHRNVLLNIVNARILIERKQLKEALILIENIPFIYPVINQDFYMAIRYAEVKARYYEATGDFKQAIKNVEQEMEYKDSLYNIDKLSSIQMVETQFTNYKQQQQLKDAQQEIKTKKTLNYLYFSVAILSLLGLIFMFRSYFYRQRNHIKEKFLLEKEKQEAELQVKLKEEVALNAIMEKELAEQDKLVALQDKLLTEQQKEKLQQELMSNRLQLETKNNFLKQIKDKLPSLQSTQFAEIKNINRTVDKSFEADAEFELLQQNFASSNPKFFAGLQQKANDTLTQLDLKYCGYIKLGMGTKEIANLMHIEPKSMRMARYRIKQKLQLEKEVDLDNFIAAS